MAATPARVVCRFRMRLSRYQSVESRSTPASAYGDIAALMSTESTRRAAGALSETQVVSMKPYLC